MTERLKEALERLTPEQVELVTVYAERMTPARSRDLTPDDGSLPDEVRTGWDEITDKIERRAGLIPSGKKP